MSRTVDAERKAAARVAAIERGRAGLRRLKRALEHFESAMTAAEAAEALGVDRVTVLRDWRRLGCARGPGDACGRDTDPKPKA